MKYDVVIVGAGHNGLVTACYLAKGGLKTLLLERRDVVGGGAELDHATGPFSQQIAADLNLKVEFITPKVRVLALSDDGRSICIYNDDVAATVREIEKFSAKDAKSYPEFVESFSRIGPGAGAVAFNDAAIDRSACERVTCGSLEKLASRFASWARRMSTGSALGADGGCRSCKRVVRDRSCCEQQWRRAEFTERLLGHGPPERVLGLLWQAALDGSAIGPSTSVKGGMVRSLRHSPMPRHAPELKIRTAGGSRAH
jgi:hypothetical protein